MTSLTVLLAALSRPQALGELIHGVSKDDLNRALSVAALEGEIDAVRMLIPIGDPTRRGTEALSWAAHRGHRVAVGELIKVQGLIDEDDKALRCAVRSGHVEIVQALIPLGNRIARTALALRFAAQNGQDNVYSNLIGSRNKHTLFFDEVANAKANEKSGVPHREITRKDDTRPTGIQARPLATACRVSASLAEGSRPTTRKGWRGGTALRNLERNAEVPAVQLCAARDQAYALPPSSR